MRPPASHPPVHAHSCLLATLPPRSAALTAWRTLPQSPPTPRILVHTHHSALSNGTMRLCLAHCPAHPAIAQSVRRIPHRLARRPNPIEPTSARAREHASACRLLRLHVRACSLAVAPCPAHPTIPQSAPGPALLPQPAKRRWCHDCLSPSSSPSSRSRPPCPSLPSALHSHDDDDAITAVVRLPHRCHNSPPPSSSPGPLVAQTPSPESLRACAPAGMTTMTTTTRKLRYRSFRVVVTPCRRCHCHALIVFTLTRTPASQAM